MSEIRVKQVPDPGRPIRIPIGREGTTHHPLKQNLERLRIKRRKPERDILQAAQAFRQLVEIFASNERCEFPGRQLVGEPVDFDDRPVDLQWYENEPGALMRQIVANLSIADFVYRFL